MSSIKNNLIIVQVDGGLCSQMSFYALAKDFEEKYGGGGVEVKLDLTWFEDYGKDAFGNLDRSYVLDKAFPNMPFKSATREEISHYKKHYSLSTRESPLDSTAPLYVCGYPLCIPSVLKYRHYFMEYFHPVDVALVQDLVDEIVHSNSCAVHVRRGDLSEYSTVYGYPPSHEYFYTAITLMRALHGNMRFYFFSDDPEWVKTSLIPKLPNIDYKICESNDSSKGYLDFYAITQCKHLIGSQGSFVSYARLLTSNQPTMITSRHKEYITCNFPNVLTINHGVKYDDKVQQKEQKRCSFYNKIRLKIYYYCKDKLQRRGLI